MILTMKLKKEYISEKTWSEKPGIEIIKRKIEYYYDTFGCKFKVTLDDVKNFINTANKRMLNITSKFDEDKEPPFTIEIPANLLEETLDQIAKYLLDEDLENLYLINQL